MMIIRWRAATLAIVAIVAIVVASGGVLGLTLAEAASVNEDRLARIDAKLDSLSEAADRIHGTPGLNEDRLARIGAKLDSLSEAVDRIHDSLADPDRDMNVGGARRVNDHLIGTMTLLKQAAKQLAAVETEPAGARYVNDRLIETMTLLKQAARQLADAESELARPRNSAGAKADRKFGKHGIYTLTSDSWQSSRGDVIIAQQVCDGVVDYPNGVWTCYGSTWIEMRHATTLTPGREGVPFPGVYEISIACAANYEGNSLIVDPNDRDISAENPRDWAVEGPAGAVTPRRYTSSPSLWIYCHDWTLTFSEAS